MTEATSVPKSKALFYAGSMLLFGSMNTIFLKYQNFREFDCVPDTYDCEICTAPFGGNETSLLTQHHVLEAVPWHNYFVLNTTDECIPFSQPVYQTYIMFTGETLCFLAYYSFLMVRRFQGRPSEEALKSNLTGWRKLLFVVPTLCDLTATTLMNVGLIYTTASVYQMLRGAVVVFTGILSVIFLKRTQYPYHVLGIIFVVAGVTVVGLASVLFAPAEDASNAVLGDILVITAQVFTACQFVFEEKYLAKYNVPALQAVGFEGIYGILLLTIIAPILQVTAGNNGDIGNLFDILFALKVLKYPSVWVSTVGCAISIAFFNFFGLSVTKVLGATSRTTIDACRTLIVWVFSLSVGWEFFTYESFFLQLFGFLLVVLGTAWYNKSFKVPFLNYAKYEPVVHTEAEEQDPLLDDSKNEYPPTDDFDTPPESPDMKSRGGLIQ